MSKKSLLPLGFLFLASLPAYAFHCPMDMKKIDAALASSPALTAQELTEVRELRAKGEAYHQAGQHQESVQVLGQAMKILGIR
jgi:hypothetical protein